MRNLQTDEMVRRNTDLLKGLGRVEKDTSICKTHRVLLSHRVVVDFKDIFHSKNCVGLFHDMLYRFCAEFGFLGGSWFGLLPLDPPLGQVTALIHT